MNDNAPSSAAALSGTLCQPRRDLLGAGAQQHLHGGAAALVRGPGGDRSRASLGMTAGDSWPQGTPCEGARAGTGSACRAFLPLGATEDACGWGREGRKDRVCLLLRRQDLVPGWKWSSHPPVCLSPHFSASLQVTVCWVEEMPASNEQSLSPQAEHAGIRTYFFSAENTEEQESWIQAMGEAARVQIPPTQRSAPTVSLCRPSPLLSWRWSGGAVRRGRAPPGSVRVPLEDGAGGALAPRG